MTTSHIPVLLEEVTEMTAPQVGETVVDCTLGAGGHSQVLCERIGESGTLIGLDADSEALSLAETKLASCDGCNCDQRLRQANFRELDQVLVEEGIGSVDIFLFDLGLRSEQLDESGRGFTFQQDEPLFMTFRHPDELTETDITAREIVNQWSKEHLVDVLEGYGDEPHAHEIAEAIVQHRDEAAIETTGQLVAIIESVVTKGRSKIHPATRTFQALRITVNDEIRTLKAGLETAAEFLSPEGRLAVISFHSTEDRVVKQVFDELVYAGAGEETTNSPVVPTEAEIDRNRRARSAKLRVFKKFKLDS